MSMYGISSLTKRKSHHSSHTNLHFIIGINHAVTRAQRMQALQTAFRAFHHANEEMHNCEIDLGAADALCLKLGYILLSRQSSDDVFTEIELVCSSLKMVYRCSVERRIRSFREIGYTELLPLFVQVLSVTALQSGSQTSAILETLLVLRVFSRLDPAKHYLIRVANLWSSLIHLIWSFEYVGETNWILLAKDAEAVQLEVLSIFKDLTFRMSDDDKRIVHDTKGFVPTLVHFGRKTPAGSRLRESIAAVWWNLALSSTVAYEMTNNGEVLSSLYHLALPGNTVKTRRNAISAIGNLASIDDNHGSLLTHEAGCLVQCLTTAANDEDVDSRRRAMRTLRCLSSGDAARELRRREDFCTFLATAAQNDLDRDTRAQALECMAHVASDSDAMNEVQHIISTAIIGTIESSNDPGLTSDACRTLHLCCLSTSELSYASFSASFYAKVSTAASACADADTHHHIAKVVSWLSSMDEFVGKTPHSALLHLLASLVSHVGPDFEESRAIAMNAIQVLAKVDGNKRILAEDENLLTALVNFAMSTEEGDKKDVAKELILKLVPEL